MRKIGIAGRQVGCIGLGAMSFGGIYGPTTEEESQDCLDAALALGIDHWDVAEIYGDGHSERMIGRFLGATPAPVTIATKAGIYRTPSRHFSNAPDRLRASLEGSLERLGRDRVELFYVHRREADRPVEAVMEFLATLVEEGLIGGIGLSEVAPATLRRAHAVHPVAAVQSEYSLWTRQPELGMVQACAELGVTFVAFSPLGRGVFARRFPDPSAFAKGDIRAGNPRFAEPNYSANRAAIAPFVAWCEARGWSPAAAAVAWTLDRGDHVLPIPGTRTASHLKEIAQAAAIRFTDAERNEIARLLPPGFAHGDRYSDAQLVGIERYC